MTYEINAIIDNLCQKLGTSATYLIPELAKKNIAENITCLLITVIVGVCLVYAAKRILKYVADNNEDMFDAVFCLVLVGIPTCADVVCIIACAVDLVGWIASPTAKAVEQIARMIG